MSDLLKDLTTYRIKSIEKAEIEYYKQLTQTLDRIESQIVALADQQLPRQAGKLIELQSAVAIRPKIKAILDKEYLPFADRVVRKGFGEQAKRVERQFKTIGIIPPEFQELTKGDLALVKNLKQQYYTQFKDVSNNFTRILSDKVYQNTLVGTEFNVSSLGGSGSLEGFNAYETTLVVAQTLQLGDKRRLSERAARAEAALASAECSVRSLEAQKLAGELYLELRAAYDMAEVAQASADLASEFSGVVQRRVVVAHAGGALGRGEHGVPKLGG